MDFFYSSSLDWKVSEVALYIITIDGCGNCPKLKKDESVSRWPDVDTKRMGTVEEIFMIPGMISFIWPLKILISF